MAKCVLVRDGGQTISNFPPERTSPETENDPASEKRIEKILERTRHETSAADLLTFAAGRAWSVLLILGAAFVVVASKFAQGSKDQEKE